MKIKNSDPGIGSKLRSRIAVQINHKPMSTKKATINKIPAPGGSIGSSSLITRLHSNVRLIHAPLDHASAPAQPGVRFIFRALKGTGAGSTAQESPEITFSKQDEAA